MAIILVVRSSHILLGGREGAALYMGAKVINTQSTKVINTVQNSRPIYIYMACIQVEVVYLEKNGHQS